MHNRLSQEIDLRESQTGGAYAEDRKKWETLLRTQTTIPEEDVIDLLARLTKERVCFCDRGQLGDEQLQQLNVRRMGYRFQITRAVSLGLSNET
jgi:hypothetical protein